MHSTFFRRPVEPHSSFNDFDFDFCSLSHRSHSPTGKHLSLIDFPSKSMFMLPMDSALSGIRVLVVLLVV